MAGLQNRLPFYVLIPRQWQEGSFVTGKKNISEAVLFFGLFFFFCRRKIEAGEGKKKELGGWCGWLRSLESVTWLPAGDLQHPPALPRPCLLDVLRLHLSTRPIHQHFITLLSLRSESLISPVFVCSIQIFFAFQLLLPNPSLSLSRLLYYSHYNPIFSLFSSYLSLCSTEILVIHFFSLHLLFSLCCLLRWTYFFSSPSSEALIFFRLALEPHPSLQITHPIWTCALRTAHTNTTSIIVQCNSIT